LSVLALELCIVYDSQLNIWYYIITKVLSWLTTQYSTTWFCHESAHWSPRSVCSNPAPEEPQTLHVFFSLIKHTCFNSPILRQSRFERIYNGFIMVAYWSALQWREL